jgi:hypothetical protein
VVVAAVVVVVPAVELLDAGLLAGTSPRLLGAVGGEHGEREAGSRDRHVRRRGRARVVLRSAVLADRAGRGAPVAARVV